MEPRIISTVPRPEIHNPGCVGFEYEAHEETGDTHLVVVVSATGYISNSAGALSYRLSLPLAEAAGLFDGPDRTYSQKDEDGNITYSLTIARNRSYPTEVRLCIDQQVSKHHRRGQSFAFNQQELIATRDDFIRNAPADSLELDTI